MELTLTSEYTDAEGYNYRPPIIAQSIWEVPPTNTPVTLASDYSAADRIFMSWLLQGALPSQGQIDPLGQASSRANAFNRPGETNQKFDSGFLDAYYGSIVRSLKVDYTPTDTTAPELNGKTLYHAAWIQALVCHNGPPDSTIDQMPAQALSFSIPSTEGGSVLYSNYNWTSFWALEPIGQLPNAGNNPEYITNPNAEEGRGLIDVAIPVRFENEPSSTYVSICTTLGALEERWGVKILAVRRYRSWLPQDLQTPPPGYRNYGDLYGSDNYVTIKFESGWRPFDFLSGVWSLDASELRQEKDDLLLAPGDVIVLERRPDRASDVPPAWMPEPSGGAQ